MSARRRLAASVAAVAATAGIAFAADAGVARAGQWMHVSCVNPDGSAAPSEGWTASTTGIGYGSSASSSCGPGAPMVADLSSGAPEPTGTAHVDLTYAPPAGSTVVGGHMSVDMYAGGYGYSASGTAVIFEPSVAYPANVRYQCASGLGPCSSSSTEPYRFQGDFAVPGDLGGTITVSAGCGGSAGASCNMAGSDPSSWSRVRVLSSDLLLQSSAVPSATNITGTVFDRRVRGTAHLLLTASAAGGPGVYSTTVAVDGVPVFSGTPNPNGGACVPVGTDPSSGALMFDHQQPCPQTVPVTVAVPTQLLADGAHELTASITDAAGNSATVLDRTIHTSNPTLTPKPRRGVRTRFELVWRYSRATTTLRSIAAHGVPRGGRLTVACRGVPHRHRHPTGCPKLAPRSVKARYAKRLLRGLRGKRFHSGTRLRITVSAPHKRPERIELRFRYGRRPTARLRTR